MSDSFGIVSCIGGLFRADGTGISLNFENAKIGSIRIGRGFRANGEVRFLNSVVSGGVDCDGGRFWNAGATAFNFENAKARAISMRSDTDGNAFSAEGDVSLRNAECGSIECDSAELFNAPGTALSLENAKTGPVYLRNGFHAEGTVQLLLAISAGDLDCSSGTFDESDASLNGALRNLWG